MTNRTVRREITGRIIQLTEQILADTREAGAGHVQAFEAALSQLADFKLDGAVASQLEWLQALASAHATFIEEASLAFVAAVKSVPPPPGVDEAIVERVRALNQQILGAAAAGGSGLLEGYETALRGIADFESSTAKATQLEWVQALAMSHARFVTDLGSTYVDAARKIIG